MELVMSDEQPSAVSDQLEARERSIAVNGQELGRAESQGLKRGIRD